MAIIQGSKLNLEVKILDDNGLPLEIDLVDKVEFCIGTLRKLYNSDGTGEVIYDGETGLFSIPLTENETFSMKTAIQYQFRVRYTSGMITASQPETIEIINSMEAAVPFDEE